MIGLSVTCVSLRMMLARSITSSPMSLLAAKSAADHDVLDVAPRLELDEAADDHVASSCEKSSTALWITARGLRVAVGQQSYPASTC